MKVPRCTLSNDRPENDACPVADCACARSGSMQHVTRANTEILDTTGTEENVPLNIIIHHYSMLSTRTALQEGMLRRQVVEPRLAVRRPSAFVGNVSVPIAW